MLFRKQREEADKAAVEELFKLLKEQCVSASTLPTIEWAVEFIPHYFPAPFSKLHHWLAKQCDLTVGAREVNVCAIAPRGNAKSTFISLVKPLRAACEKTEMYILIVSDSQSQAEKHLASVRTELTSNSKLAEKYPGACGEPLVERHDRIVLKNGVCLEALGTGSKIRGRRHGQHRPSLIIVDDPENDQHRDSALQRERSWEWFSRALMKAGDDKTNVFVIGTALHRECLVLRLMGRPGWVSKGFKSLMQWPEKMELWEEWKNIYFDTSNEEYATLAKNFFHENKHNMELGTEVLWPEREPLYKLMCMWADDPVAFDSEKNNNPIDPSACEWPESYFKDDNIWFNEWPSRSELGLVIISLDPSKGKKAKSGDYSSIIILKVTLDGKVYVDCDMKRRPVEDMVVDSVSLCRKHRPNAFTVEINVFQELLVGEFERESERVGYTIPIQGINNQIKKEVRIRSIGPYLATRKIKFKKHSVGCQMLINQLKDFPNAAYDDGPDSLEMAITTMASLYGEDNVAEDGVSTPDELFSQI